MGAEMDEECDPALTALNTRPWFWGIWKTMCSRCPRVIKNFLGQLGKGNRKQKKFQVRISKDLGIIEGRNSRFSVF